MDSLDVVIIGAGIAGISAAAHLTEAGLSYTVLEARTDLGGTWDLFRYPGIRSDSNMQTYGYGFHLWTQPNVLSDGASIKEYLTETARGHGVDRHIRYGHAVRSLEWSSTTGRWTVIAAVEGHEQTLTADFVVVSTGYYDYADPYSPEFTGIGDFTGTVVHPQHWPDDLDYAGKKIAVIGSGATAVTLVPTLARDARVAMIQRTPGYLLSLPSIDPVSVVLERLLPARLVYRISRLRNIWLESTFYFSSRRFPNAVRNVLLRNVRRRLHGVVDMSHFTPDYAPWDQRVCVVPDGDIFRSIRSGDATIHTSGIERFTPTGLRLDSGEDVEADVIVTATGLNLQFLGGIAVSVDGEAVALPDRMTYKSVMIEDVPNLVFVLGHTNSSWTLKVDATATYLVRLLRYMRTSGHRTVVPHDDAHNITEKPFFDNMTSGYLRRRAHLMPRQGRDLPWASLQDGAHDATTLRYGPIADGILTFDGRRPRERLRPRTALVHAPRFVRQVIMSLR